MAFQPPTGLLRDPVQPGGNDSPLEDLIEQPIVDETRRRNRYRKPTAQGRTTDGPIYPVLSEDAPALFVSRTRTSAAGHATIVGLADEKPAEGEGLAISINGNHVFEGRIDTALRDESGVLTASAYDDTRVLRQTDFDGSYNDASVGHVVRDVCRQAGVTRLIDRKFLSIEEVNIDGEPIPAGYTRIVDETGEDVRTGDDTTQSGTGGEAGPERSYPTITRDYSGANCASVLTELAHMVDALWFVNRFNVCRFTTKPDVDEYLINGILKSSAGAQEPPYQRIIVVGGSAGNPKGERRRRMFSKNPIRASAGNENAPKARTYVAKRPGINSQKMAQNIANSVMREMQKQMAAGTITLVGRGVLNPLDVIHTAEYFADESYLVSGIQHTIDKTDGYRSIINVGGRVPEGA